MRRRRSAACTTYAWGALVLLAAGLTAVADDAVRLMTTPDFYGAAKVVPWIAAGVVFQGIYLLTSIGLNITKQTKYYPIATGAAAVASVGANLVLIPRFGVMGAAWSNTMAYAVLAITAMRFFAARVSDVLRVAPHRPDPRCRCGHVHCGAPADSGVAVSSSRVSSPWQCSLAGISAAAGGRRVLPAWRVAPHRNTGETAARGIRRSTTSGSSRRSRTRVHVGPRRRDTRLAAGRWPAPWRSPDQAPVRAARTTSGADHRARRRVVRRGLRGRRRGFQEGERAHRRRRRGALLRVSAVRRLRWRSAFPQRLHPTVRAQGAAARRCRLARQAYRDGPRAKHDVGWSRPGVDPRLSAGDYGRGDCTSGRKRLRARRIRPMVPGNRRVQRSDSGHSWARG